MLLRTHQHQHHAQQLIEMSANSEVLASDSLGISFDSCDFELDLLDDIDLLEDVIGEKYIFAVTFPKIT